MRAVLLMPTVLAAAAPAANAPAADASAPAPNGIAPPQGYRDWRVIAVSHRRDNNSLRVILGDDVAIEAGRAGRTNPWPDGAILAKPVWKDGPDANWEAATVPGAFVHAEFMIKDSRRHAATLGWGFARGPGAEQKPYGKDAGFVAECMGCHAPLADRDLVFTTPVVPP